MANSIVSRKGVVIVSFAGVLFGGIAILALTRRTIEPETFVRSVTALELRRLDPVDEVKLTGTIQAWKEESLGFEVPGRVVWVADRGVEVGGGGDAYGVSTNGDGVPVARLDPKEYQLRLKTAEARLKIAKAKLEAMKLQIAEVKSRQLEAAAADLSFARNDYDRLKRLLEKDVISRKEFDNAEMVMKVAVAKRDEARASVDVLKAELQAGLAEIEQLAQAVENARLDVARTTLRAPFSGVVADVFLDVGANVAVGEKVVRLVALEPIVAARLNVSSERDRQLHYSQFVNVFAPSLDEPIKALVNRKATIADPSTHTFELELLVPNKKVPVAEAIPRSVLDLPRIESAFPAGMLKRRGEEALAVLETCLRRDQDGEYAWRCVPSPKSIPGASVFTLEKIRVETYPEKLCMMGVYPYQFVKSADGLKNRDVLAIGVPDGVGTSDEVALIHRRYLFRPGDMVKVALNGKPGEAGFYVPADLISTDGRRSWIFTVERKPDGSFVAKRVSVNRGETFNDHVLIESPNLREGDRIVSDGAHFIKSNEVINVKSVERASL